MTPSIPLYPLLMQPSLHVKVWGGRRLESVMGKALPTAEPYGESWEVHDTATIVNGVLAGKTLAEVLALYGRDLVGAHHDPALGFPLLLKYLDANDWLSVQVHPNDEQAQKYDHEPRGKTEAWYVLAAEPNAKLIYGMKPGTTKEDMAAAIRETRLEPLLNYVDAKVGDTFFVKPGTVHALGPGLLIYEIQQSSDLTYRLYDWGRMGLDGKPREMHIDKGVAVSNMSITSPNDEGESAESYSPIETLFRCEYFSTWRDHVQADPTNPVEYKSGGYLRILTAQDGDLTVEANGFTVPFRKGQSVLIPASIADYRVSGVGTLLTSSG